MTAWVKLDDDYYDHAKFAACGPMAELLWIRMLAWSHRNLTDGVVPVRAIKRLADFTRELVEHDRDRYRDGDPDRPMAGVLAEANWLDLLDRLLDAGLVDDDPDDPDAFRIHDYLAKQTSAETVEKRRDAGRRGGIKSGERRQKWQPNEASGAVVLDQNGKPNASRDEANGEPDSRSQISDNSSSSSLYLVVGGEASEEEAATPEAWIVVAEAAALHAERALKRQAPGSVPMPDRWKLVAARNWRNEHGLRIASLLAQRPDMTAEQLLGRVEGGSLPGYTLAGPVVHPEITDASRAASVEPRAQARAAVTP